jgi:hypothetical protein
LGGRTATTATVSGSVAAWLPQPGPQTYLLVCPVREIFYGGARGGGKSVGILLHWQDHAARWAEKARGIIFRRSYDEFEEVLRIAKLMFFPLYGPEIYNKVERRFTFPNGAVLTLRYLKRDEDAEHYQGHSYNWMAFDEITNWGSPTPVDKLWGALRSAEGVPCWMLLTGNPGGRGHTWVKERYITAAPPLTPFYYTDTKGNKHERIYIPSRISDNPKLLQNDPGYVDRLRLTGADWLVDAWLTGNWDVAAGSYLEGVWQPDQHVIRPRSIPPDWRRWRAMDWGYARPYSIGWYAMDPDGVIYRYRELYGWGGKPNVGTKETAHQVAKHVLKLETGERKVGITFKRSPADSSIWDKNGTEQSVGDHFHKAGVLWMPAQKGPGSRVNGAHEVVQRLKEGSFKVFDTCRHFIRTVPVLPISEEDPDDVDTDAEDHAWDELRYSLISRQRKPTKKPPPDAGLKPFTQSWVEYEGDGKKNQFW